MSAVAEMGGLPGQSAASIRREGWLRRLPLLPAFIYVILITQIPFALTVYYSFFSWNLLKDNSFKFAGLENYARLLTDESFRTALLNTVVLTVSVIALSVIIGLGVATLLNSEVFGKGIMRTLMIAPFLIMPTAGALIWKDTLLNPLFGLLPYVLSPLGLGRVDWVNQYPMQSVVVVEVWRWTPFMMLIILAGLQSQNPEVLEAARVDGASALQAFRRITLPLVRPFIELGALLGSLFVVQTFDSIFMLTHGGPGEAGGGPAMSANAMRSNPVGGFPASKVLWTIVGWLVVFIFFFPVLWMWLEAFKTEPQAASSPPTIFFVPTLLEFQEVMSGDFPPFFINSAIASLGSTLLVLIFGLPAAYALAIRPIKRTQDVLFFFISTRFLPFAASLVPLYLLARDLHLLDNIFALTLIYTTINLPLGVWLLRSFLLEIPHDLFEAARVDGASFLTELVRIVIPLIAPGIAATSLICLIFSWNEFFYAVNFTSSTAATAPVFLVGFISGRGLFYAKLAAAATLASLPVLLAGWIAQKQLIRGLTLGAVK